MLASIGVGLGFGLLGSSLSLGVGVAMIRARGYDVLIDSGDVRRLLLGTMLMSALWAAAGVGLGELVSDEVAGIVGLFAWVFVVEILLFQYLPGVEPVRTGAAGTAMTGDRVGDSSISLLSAPAGGAVLAGYAIVLVAAGALVTSRRDVTYRAPGRSGRRRPLRRLTDQSRLRRNPCLATTHVPRNAKIATGTTVGMV